MSLIGEPDSETTKASSGGTDSGPQNVVSAGRTSLLRSLGPGLITGAADDDPSGIATYAQTGSQFGYQLGWVMLFSFPLMAVIQGVSAGIGAVTGVGIAENLRRHYSPWLLRFAVGLLLVANIFNLGADLSAMGAALDLLIKGPVHFYALGFGILCAALEIWVSYQRYVNVLKWLTLSLLSYVVVAFAVHVSWHDALYNMLVPHLVFDHDHATALVALLGTTISPYLFFWQAGEEVEELHRRRRQHLASDPTKAAPELSRIRFDTLLGMGISNLIALFIIIATAATLHVNGIVNIGTAAQAAEALRPIAGPFTFVLFAAGIIGTGLLAVPVLAGSGAYAVAEMFRWKEGLEHRPTDAKAFYATIGFATLAGVILTFTPLDPMKALYWSAVLNGILASPLMFIMMAIGRNKTIMGSLTMPRWMTVAGYSATAVMAAATITFFVV